MKWGMTFTKLMRNYSAVRNMFALILCTESINQETGLC